MRIRAFVVVLVAAGVSFLVLIPMPLGVSFLVLVLMLAGMSFLVLVLMPLGVSFLVLVLMLAGMSFLVFILMLASMPFLVLVLMLADVSFLVLVLMPLGMPFLVLAGAIPLRKVEHHDTRCGHELDRFRLTGESFDGRLEPGCERLTHPEDNLGFSEGTRLRRTHGVSVRRRAGGQDRHRRSNTFHDPRNQRLNRRDVGHYPRRRQRRHGHEQGGTPGDEEAKGHCRSPGTGTAQDVLVDDSNSRQTEKFFEINWLQINLSWTPCRQIIDST